MAKITVSIVVNAPDVVAATSRFLEELQGLSSSILSIEGYSHDD